MGFLDRPCLIRWCHDRDDVIYGIKSSTSAGVTFIVGTGALRAIRLHSPNQRNNITAGWGNKHAWLWGSPGSGSANHGLQWAFRVGAHFTLHTFIADLHKAASALSLSPGCVYSLSAHQIACRVVLFSAMACCGGFYFSSELNLDCSVSAWQLANRTGTKTAK